MIHVFLLSFLLTFANPAATPGPTPEVSPTPSPKLIKKPTHTPTPTPKEEKVPSPPRLETTKKSKATSYRHASAKPTQTAAAPHSAPFLAEEAVNLIIPNQKYLLKFEDEESFGKIQAASTNTISTLFSAQEVETYQKAIKYIADYRNQLKQKCLGESSRKINESLEKYIASLCQFNRKALAMVADITENNNAMILVINRSTLVDAPVLVSRYFQFKKQRFKENMQRFMKDDNKLVSQMVQIAKTFKVDVSDDNWNKTYGLRENGLETISQWPRELIFQATEKLASVKEAACILNLTSEQEAKLAE